MLVDPRPACPRYVTPTIGIGSPAIYVLAVDIGQTYRRYGTAGGDRLRFASGCTLSNSSRFFRMICGRYLRNRTSSGTIWNTTPKPLAPPWLVVP
jgi:hypothetical protein